MIPGVGRTKWSAGRSGAGGRGGCETGAPGGGGGEGGAAERAGRVTPPHPRPTAAVEPPRAEPPPPAPAPPRRVRRVFGKTRQGLWALVAFRGPVPWVFFPELPGGTENRAVKPLYFGQAVVPQASPELHAPSSCFHVHAGPAALSACAAL